MGSEGKLLVARKNIVVSKDSIGIDKDLTKDRNLNTFKMYCKQRKSSARFPDRKARNPLYACHCIAGNERSSLKIALRASETICKKFKVFHHCVFFLYTRFSSLGVKHCNL